MLLKTYIKNIENSFGDYAKNEYDIIVNQLSNSDNESNFNLNFEDLYISIPTSYINPYFSISLIFE